MPPQIMSIRAALRGAHLCARPGHAAAAAVAMLPGHADALQRLASRLIKDTDLQSRSHCRAAYFRSGCPPESAANVARGGRDTVVQRGASAMARRCTNASDFDAAFWSAVDTAAAVRDKFRCWNKAMLNAAIE